MSLLAVMLLIDFVNIMITIVKVCYIINGIDDVCVSRCLMFYLIIVTYNGGYVLTVLFTRMAMNSSITMRSLLTITNFLKVCAIAYYWIVIEISVNIL